VSAPPSSPYKGLASFADSDLDERFFFGRDREIELVTANLVASRLTVLYGPSGVGKSSLLRAGVVRRLRALVPAGPGTVAGDGALPIVVDAWRDDPDETIATAAGARLPAPDEALADVLAERAAEIDGELYLVLDQVEEYFVYHGRDRGGPLRDSLAEILSRPELRVHVLLGIRDDALAELDAFKGRVPALFGNVLRLDHLDRAAAQEAIRRPLVELEALGGPRVAAEPAFVAAVVDQVASGRIERRLAGRGIVPGAAGKGRVEAPYLQLVLERVWEVERLQGSSVLRAETLAELGGAGRIVQRHLEHALAGLDEPDRELVSRLFHQLVTPSGTKIAHGVDDLSRYAGVDVARLEGVLHELSSERVVRTLPGRNGGGARYEIFHDVLAAAVLDWGARHESERVLSEERAAARRRFRRMSAIAGLALVGLALMALLTAYAFDQRAEAEQQTQRANLAQARAEEQAELAATAQADAEASAATALENEQRAVDAAAEARAAEQRADEQAAEAKRLAAVADDQRAEAERQQQEADEARAAATQIAASEAAARDEAVAAEQEAVQAEARAVTAKNRAVRAEMKAVAARSSAERSGRRAIVARKRAEADALVAEAVSLLPIDPEGSLQLALRSAARARTSELEGVLRDGLFAARAQAVLPGAGGPVERVAVSADGSLVIVTSAEGEARVYELATGRPLARLQHGAPIGDLAVSADGSSAVTGGADGVAIRWNAHTGRRLGRVVHGAPIRALALSPDGRLLATAAGEAARVWSVADGSPVARLQHPFAVDGVSFDPAGTRLLTLARDARIFGVGNWGAAPIVLDQPGQIVTASFAPTGNLVATGGRDDLATIWDGSDGARRHQLEGHRGDVIEVAWSPSGAHVATASSDNGGRVFRSDTGELLTFLGAHSNQVVGVAFSPDGRAVATASLDGSARVWSGSAYERSASLLGHSRSVLDVTFAPNGLSVVTGSADGSARLWKPSVDPVLSLVGRHEAAGRAVAVSPDGALIASAGLERVVRLWRREGIPVRAIPQPAGVIDVAFSADGRLLVAGGSDGIARVWRVRDGRALQSFDHGAPLTSTTFDPGGQRVLTAGQDGIARVWRRAGGAPRELRHGGGAVAAAAFSPNGVYAATAGADTEGRVWRVATGRLVGKLTGHHDDALTSIAYSPDGSRLVTSSTDADAHLWNATTLAHVRALVGHTAVVSDVAFSSDGRWIATAGPTTVGLWETRQPRRIEKGTPVFFLRGHGPRVRSVAFVPGTRRVVSTGDDGTVRTYLCELCGPTGQLLARTERKLDRLGANLTPAERTRYIGG
jgi:WD40 repeat protein